MLYAQLESGIPLRPSAINLTQLIRELGDTIQKQATAKGLFCHVLVADDLCLTTDNSLFTKVMTELLDNAIKFTCSGGITLTARFADEGKHLILVEVKDTGIGIPREKHAVVLEEFRQAQEGYNRPYEGSGLGLSIAAKSMDLLGGSLTLTSEAGCGATFSITLPASWKEGEPCKHNEVKKSSVSAEPGVQPVTKPVILLVEDNEANIELVRLFLRGGYELEVAKEGESALRMVSHKHYDCILMDINLGPGMDGIDVITEIRKIPSYLSTPIIAITGYTFRNEKEFIISKGANLYIEKPFTRQVLEDTLRKALT